MITSIEKFTSKFFGILAKTSFAAVLLDTKRVLLVDRFNAKALYLVALATWEVSVDVDKTMKVDIASYFYLNLVSDLCRVKDKLLDHGPGVCLTQWVRT